MFLETDFSFNNIYFGLQLSRFRPVLIYDMHERKFHQPCSGLLSRFEIEALDLSFDIIGKTT